MTIHQQIKEKLIIHSEDEILTKMGYYNLKTGRETLQKFLDSKDIYHWLKCGNFDMKYGSRAFLEKLTEVLTLPNEAIKEEIERAKVHQDRISAMRNPSVYVDTHFKRKNEPVFALAMMESKRRIKIDKEWVLDMNLEEVLESIGGIIREHYAGAEGKLPIWGKIYSYCYCHIDESRYIFDTEGSLAKDTEEIIESKATLKVGNRDITNLIGGA